MELKSHEIERLRRGECIGPFYLEDISKLLGIEIGKAPQYISINRLSRLPGILKVKLLYPIRIGQWKRGRAGFILCKASKKFVNETFSFNSLHENSVKDMEFNIDDLLVRLTDHLRGESIASSIAINIVLNNNEKPFTVLPQYRIGRVRFGFSVEKGFPQYFYDGQVEVDTVIILRDRVYVVEAKEMERNDSIFKYQIGFSMKAISNILKTMVKGIIAIKYVDTNTVIYAETNELSPNEQLIINNLKIEKTYKVVLN